MQITYGEDPCQLIRPEGPTGPFVFNSPHSGRTYLDSFVVQSGLEARELRKSEDFLVDRLFESVTTLGAPLLAANFPRAWLDVNREPYELDPKMFEGKLPAFANTRSSRVAGGLGTIAKIVSEDKPIYSGKLTVAEALARIEEVYKPYHAKLRGLMAEAIVTHGYGVLIDCHSMPSAGTQHYTRNNRSVRAEFVLGDRYGSSCAPQLTAAAAEILTELGYTVTINKPYAGGFITEHYGRPINGLHAIQIEINRALYMDEEKMAPNENCDALASDIFTFARNLMDIDPEILFAKAPLAAE